MKKQKTKNIPPTPNPQKAKPEQKKSSTALLVAAFILFLVLIITYASFSPSLKCDFTNWDDPRYVLENPLLKSTKSENIKEIFKTKEVSLNYHPLTILSLAMDYQKAKLDKPEVYHRTNLMLHIANTLLVFVLIYLFSNGRMEVAGFTALFFGIHPMHVESVTWIAERKDVLYTFFFLLALIAYLKFTDKKQWWFYVIALIAFTLSLLSKAMAVTLPVIMLLFDFLKGRKLEAKLFLEKIPFFLLSLAFGIAALRIQSQGAIAEFDTFTIFQRVMFASYGAIMYLVKLFAPVKLSAFYPYPNLDNNGNIPAEFYAAPVILLLITALVFWSLKKTKLLFFAFAFYLVSVAMVLQFISVGSAIMADRYTYIAYIGPFFCISLALSQLDKKYNTVKWGGYAVLMIAALVFARITFERTSVWKNSETLWSDVISKYPTVEVAYKNRGNYYGQNGKHDEALKDYAVFLKLNQEDPNIYVNYGNVMNLKNQNDKALEAYNKALALDPNNFQALMNRGNIHGTFKMYPEAIADYNRVEQLDPNFTQLYFNRGLTFLNSGNVANSVTDFNVVLKREPENVPAWLNRGVAYFQAENYQAALADFMQAIKLQGNNGEAWFKASVTAFKMNNLKDAETFALKARSLGYKVEDSYLQSLKSN
ncbi:MAG: tetratricopeptide repeat protein [Bacteroidia bacterium]